MGSRHTSPPSYPLPPHAAAAARAAPPLAAAAAAAAAAAYGGRWQVDTRCAVELKAASRLRSSSLSLRGRGSEAGRKGGLTVKQTAAQDGSRIRLCGLRSTWIQVNPRSGSANRDAPFTSCVMEWWNGGSMGGTAESACANLSWLRHCDNVIPQGTTDE